MATEIARSDLQISGFAKTEGPQATAIIICRWKPMPHSLPTSHTNKDIFMSFPLPSFFCGLPQGWSVVQSWQQRKRFFLSWSHSLPNKTVLFPEQEEEDGLRIPESSRVLCSILCRFCYEGAVSNRFVNCICPRQKGSPKKGCWHSWWGHVNAFQNGRQNHKWMRRGYEGGSHMEVDSHV